MLPMSGVTQLNVEECYGAILIGAFLSIILYGGSLTQALHYARTDYKDRPRKKLYVVAMLLLSTLQTILCVHISYNKLVTNFGTQGMFWKNVWSMNLHPLSSGVLIVWCQSFYLRRLYSLSGAYRLLACVAAALLLSEMGFTIAATVNSFRSITYTQFQRDDSEKLITFSYGSASAANFLMTVSLLEFLRRSRANSMSTNTSSSLDRLMTCTLSTGAITTIASILVLVLSLESKSNMIFIASDTVASKLYTNAVLATLNLRKPATAPHLERAADALRVSTTPIIRPPGRPRPQSQFLGTTTSPAIEICVTREYACEVSGPDLLVDEELLKAEMA